MTASASASAAKIGQLVLDRGSWLVVVSTGENDDDRATAAVGFLFSHVLPAVTGAYLDIDKLKRCKTGTAGLKADEKYAVLWRGALARRR